jgi:hypothetical protein
MSARKLSPNSTGDGGESLSTARPTPSAASTEERIEELEEAIRNMLDVVVGWTRPMTDGEKFRAIRAIGEKVLDV